MGAKGGVFRFLPLRNEAGAEAQIIQNGGDGFGVAEFASANPSFDFARRERPNGNALVVLGMRGAGAKIARDINQHAFADEAGSREEVEDSLPAARRVTRFFEEFAFRARKRLLAAFDASSDEFPQIVADGMAILPNQEQAAIVENGKDDDGAIVHDEVSRGAYAARFDDRVATNVEDAPMEERFAGNKFRARDNVPP